jgi:hypothetical protein
MVTQVIGICLLVESSDRAAEYVDNLEYVEFVQQLKKTAPVWYGGKFKGGRFEAQLVVE